LECELGETGCHVLAEERQALQHVLRLLPLRSLTKESLLLVSMMDDLTFKALSSGSKLGGGEDSLLVSVDQASELLLSMLDLTHDAF